MKMSLLLFVICTSLFARAQDSDFKSDLNTVKPPKQERKPNNLRQKKESPFEQKFAEDYAGFYALNTSKTCSLNSNVKKVKLDLKGNEGNPSIRVIFYDAKDQILENKFYPLSKAKVSKIKSPSKDGMSLLWESAIQKEGNKSTKFERISFAKEVVSFDVDRWVGGEGFFDKLLTSTTLEKSSKCNFTKVDNPRKNTQQYQLQPKGTSEEGTR